MCEAQLSLLSTITPKNLDSEVSVITLNYSSQLFPDVSITIENLFKDATKQKFDT